jgi:hypothetical protein
LRWINTACSTDTPETSFIAAVKWTIPSHLERVYRAEEQDTGKADSWELKVPVDMS